MLASVWGTLEALVMVRGVLATTAFRRKCHRQHKRPSSIGSFGCGSPFVPNFGIGNGPTSHHARIIDESVSMLVPPIVPPIDMISMSGMKSRLLPKTISMGAVLGCHLCLSLGRDRDGSVRSIDIFFQRFRSSSIRRLVVFNFFHVASWRIPTCRHRRVLPTFDTRSCAREQWLDSTCSLS